MLFFLALLRTSRWFYVLGFMAFFLLSVDGLVPKAAGFELAKLQQPQAQVPSAPVSNYDKAIFLKPIPSDQLAFLNQFSGVAAKDVIHDKEFRKLMKDFVPDCMFHYGRDMPLSDALEMVFKDSTEQILIREGRYMVLSGQSGPYLAGRGFVWIDMQDGIGLGGFYFRPTNGEPTPSVVIFSRQVKEASMTMSQLPPEFANDLIQWSTEHRVGPVTTRYFITGSNKRILLEHDEEYCRRADGAIEPPESGCEQMDADAADIDMNVASYLEATHHATNATAWMINDPDQVAWVQMRDNTCRSGPDLLGCHIRMTRERTRVIVRGPMPHPPHR